MLRPPAIHHPSFALLVLAFVGTLVCVAKGSIGELRMTNAESLGERLGGAIDSAKSPLVFAHGMGDSCFNPGMKQITKLAGQYAGVYSTCIAEGSNQPEDTTNGFFMNMNKQVDYFAKQVKADENLQQGFSAVGLSQGNLVIRGYIEKYNDPPVIGFLSINGPLAGTASLPRCNPDGWVGYLCKKATDLVGDAAYTSVIQEHVAQANFLKVPGELDAYLKVNPFLPYLNNEIEHADSKKFRDNFASISKLVLVKADSDTMIFPRETAWFAYFDNDHFGRVLPMNETQAYTTNAFGLRSLAESNRIVFRSSPGDHLDFSLRDLQAWLKDLYE
mmetsp:Transcript_7856/g.15610  ORF Transcript_7856/g.15610 Transcript_7856/m.15610 type:complete len:331 (-) Transcript_7856:431-1423(-)